MTLRPGDENIKYLYKYRKINEHTFKNLKNGTFTFSKPNLFNDTFDCRISTKADGSKDDMKKWIEAQSRSQNEKEKLYNHIEKEADLKDIFKYYNPEQSNSVFVLSMSEKPKSIKMWLRYADQHKGICLGFKTEIKNNGLSLNFSNEESLSDKFHGYWPVLKVNYSEEMPLPFNILKDTDTERYVEFLKTKHIDWKYEQERRVILPKSEIKGLHEEDRVQIRYDKDILKEVIFGLKTSDDDRKEVKSYIEKYYPDCGKDIKIFEAVSIKGESKSELEIKEV